MMNMLKFEVKKLKHEWLLMICYLIIIGIPIVTIAANLIVKVQITSSVGQTAEAGINFIKNLQLLNQPMVFPILSSFVISFLFQKEYADRTLLNILTAPVERFNFFFTKILIWFGWMLVALISFLLVVLAGVYLIDGAPILEQVLEFAVKHILQYGLLSILTFLPVVIVAILQKNNFYPVILVALGFTALGYAGAGVSLPDKLASLLPWTAIFRMTFVTKAVVNLALAYPSILICGAVSLLLAFYLFKKQEL